MRSGVYNRREILPKNNGERICLVSGKRTPFGKFGGTLAKLSPLELALSASRELLKQINLSAHKVDQVFFANVIPSTPGTLYGGRHLALELGMEMKTPAMTVNRLCGSGIEGILQACRLIELERAECILVSGAENMSMVPHLTYGARFGRKYGALKSVDLLLAVLTDEYAQISMGETAEKLALNYNISRTDCEDFALRSHQKACLAYERGLIQEELAPVLLGKTEMLKDEHLREHITLAELAALSPSFQKNGVVTPATASGIVDGAASVVVASEGFLAREGLSAMAEIVDGDTLGVDPTIMGVGPVPVIRNILKRSRLDMEEIDLFEINEAFASQILAVVEELGLDINRLNLWGGALALGHPLGATGVRISLTLARQLQMNKLNWAIASACIGGGQGIGLLLKGLE
jgi:acetyl-CoA C-acetyltransferase/acetyl-CoA acyltransferase 2